MRASIPLTRLFNDNVTYLCLLQACWKLPKKNRFLTNEIQDVTIKRQPCHDYSKLYTPEAMNNYPDAAKAIQIIEIKLQITTEVVRTPERH